MLISGPETYGLSEQQTLAHRAEGDPPEEFASFWGEFKEEVLATPATWRGAVDAEINQLVIPSIRAVRVIGRLTLPVERPRGLVIATHGAVAPDGFSLDPEPWSSRQLATLRLRLRGYPPSTLDIEDIREHWIEHRLAVADSWIVRGAVADVVQAYRCARGYFGPDVPIALHGESLGGGLAVIAARQLSELGDPPTRLILALPSLGDWRWRSSRYCGGLGGRVNEELVRMRDEAPRMMNTLLLFDAAFHASGIESPTLCKLAVRDDVVPAPSAAAVFNALPGGRKWRLVTRYGHYDGGIADLRRHARFEQIHRRFADPACEPETAIGDRTGHSDL